VEDEIVEPQIAVNDAQIVVLRHVLRQPLDQTFHGLDGGCFGGVILLAPTRDLAVQIGFARTVIAKAQGIRIESMQRRNHAVHVVEHRRAFAGCQAWRFRVPEHPSFDVAHDVEQAADDLLVAAQGQRFGDGYGAAMQGADDAKLAIHRMRRGEQFARRLAPQDQSFTRNLQKVGRIGLAAFKLGDLQFTA
jgi:hypothetical protein